MKKFQPHFNRFNRLSTEPGNFWQRGTSKAEHIFGADYISHFPVGIYLP